MTVSMSSMTGTTDLATAPSPEAAFLDEMQRKARQWIGSGAVATVVGALIFAASFGEVGIVFGGAGVGSGLFFVWFGFTWLRLLPKAGVALTMPPIDVRLEAKRNLGVWKRSTKAQL